MSPPSWHVFWIGAKKSHTAQAFFHRGIRRYERFPVRPPALARSECFFTGAVHELGEPHSCCADLAGGEIMMQREHPIHLTIVNSGVDEAFCIPESP